jgi:hypothetical protein
MINPHLPQPASLRCRQIIIYPSTVTIVVETMAPTGLCPLCSRPSGRIHSRYTRTLADLPWQGRIVRWCLEVRKFFCGTLGCPRRIFTEHLPDVADVRARKTTRLLPVQLLWLNLVTNGIQDVALAFEPSEGGVLRRKPRPPREPIFNRLMIERTIIGAIVMGCVAFGVFGWLLSAGWSEASARNAILLLVVLFEIVHIGNCRSETKSAFWLSPLRNPILIAGSALAMLVHIAMMYLPVGRTLLEVEPVKPAVWLALLGCALTVIVAIEIHKLVWRLRHR